jgi:hypothetical protein
MPKLIFQKITSEEPKTIITQEISQEEEELFMLYVSLHEQVKGFYRYKLTSDKGNMIYDCCISYILDYIRDIEVERIRRTNLCR